MSVSVPNLLGSGTSPGKRKVREEKRITHLRGLAQLQREATDIKGWLASLPETAAAEYRKRSQVHDTVGYTPLG